MCQKLHHHRVLILPWKPRSSLTWLTVICIFHGFGGPLCRLKLSRTYLIYDEMFADLSCTWWPMYAKLLEMYTCLAYLHYDNLIHSGSESKRVINEQYTHSRIYVCTWCINGNWYIWVHECTYLCFKFCSCMARALILVKAINLCFVKRYKYLTHTVFE